MRLKDRFPEWVIINYPVVTSRGQDNSGGREHLIGNIQVYQLLGFRVICLCRLSWPLVDKLSGAVCLNVIPGSAIPKTHEDRIHSNVIDTNQDKFRIRCHVLLRCLRRRVFDAIYRVLRLFLSPIVVHQRANQRFMGSEECLGSAVHLVELNDLFIPDILCQGYLTVAYRVDLELPQLVSPWPVPSSGMFEYGKFESRLDQIAGGHQTINVLLFGYGGVESETEVHEFLSNHVWFRSKSIILHIYGASKELLDGDDRIVTHKWMNENLLPKEMFQAGVIYYSNSTYDDDRLQLGSPTKLYKYIDWSLPIVSNRPIISRRYLGGFDQNEGVLKCESTRRDYADLLMELRNNASVEIYASRIQDFVGRVGMPAKRIDN